MSDDSKAMKTVLRRARKVLARPDRWYQGTYKCLGGGCLFGVVFNTDFDNHHGFNEFQRKLHRHLLDTIWSCGFYKVCPLGHLSYADLTDFNDDKRRKHRHILKVLDRAIKTA